MDWSPTSSNTCDWILHIGVGVLNVPADGSIVAAKMAANSIDSDQYVDASIDNAHLADGAVTMAKLDATGTEADNVKQRVAKVWILLNGSSFASTDDFNVASVTDNGTGDYTVTIDADMANANYCAVIDPAKGTGDVTLGTNINTRAVGSLRFECGRDNSVLTDAQNVSMAIFGDS